jgi:transcriptional antiterminator NusG
MEQILEKSTKTNWYVVRTQSNRERSVSEKILKEVEKGELTGKVSQVLVPMEKSFYVKGGKKVKREKVLYPGYIFIETSAIGELKYFLKGCNGATGFLTNKSGEIKPLSLLEVNKMIGQQEEAEEVELENPFVVGEDVKITDGPFDSMIGTIESISGQKVKVVVSIFGRKTPVEVDMMQIDKK